MKFFTKSQTQINRTNNLVIEEHKWWAALASSISGFAEEL